jgi:hypothetical protein
MLADPGDGAFLCSNGGLAGDVLTVFIFESTLVMIFAKMVAAPSAVAVLAATTLSLDFSNMVSVVTTSVSLVFVKMLLVFKRSNFTPCPRVREFRWFPRTLYIPFFKVMMLSWPYWPEKFSCNSSSVILVYISSRVEFHAVMMASNMFWFVCVSDVRLWSSKYESLIIRAFVVVLLLCSWSKI